MCGIVGFVTPMALKDNPKGSSGGRSSILQSAIDAMTDALTHRGPDDKGTWIWPDPEGEASESKSFSLALGHRRLSIIDLAPTGHQPMASPYGPLVMVYNGEIYNFASLRHRLEAEGHTTWQGHSDTEVLLRCFEVWGIKKTLEEICGMFAIALFNRATQELTLIRDRMGEKPLYYGWVGNVFVFGSELKVLKHLSKLDLDAPENLSQKNQVSSPQRQPHSKRGYLQIDDTALRAFFTFGYVPAPQSIFKGIYKLPPGTFVTLNLRETFDTITPSAAPWLSQESRHLPPVIPFWQARSFFSEPSVPINATLDQAADRLGAIMAAVIDETSVSDVPIGAFLSGGIDSTLVTTMMQRTLGKDVQTFSIGFEEKAFNEAQHAKAVASYLGTHHHELFMTGKDAQVLVQSIAHVYDEPFADSSQLPTMLVAQLARRHVTVAISGDGADELFGGYGRYREAQLIRAFQHMLPPWARQSMSRVGRRMLQTGIPEKLTTTKMGKKLGGERSLRRLKRGLDILALPPEDTYETMIAVWQHPHHALTNEDTPRPPSSLYGRFCLDNQLYTTNLLHIDMMTYLPDDIMVKVDRASMACGLETRAPFLDRRIVEFSCGLPLPLKVAGHPNASRQAWVGKAVVKHLLYRFVPKSLLDRPKQGFGVPLSDWLRHDLREWAEDLLSSSSLASSGLLNIDAIQNLWHTLQNKDDTPVQKIWAVLMFQSWYKDWNEYLA